MMEAMTRPVQPIVDAEAPPAGGSRGEELRAAACALAAGDARALDRIWEVAADRIYGLALWRTGSPEDAEDVVQEVFVRLARFPARLGRARDPHAYLMRVTHNAAIDAVTRRRPAEPLEAAAPVLLIEPAGETAVDAARLARHLADLPATQREAVYLRHLLGLSFREIGAVTRVPTFTAATRCRLGIGRLRRALGVST